MAKFRKKPVVIDAERYKPGMEDGFNCYWVSGHRYIGYYPKGSSMPRCYRVPAIFTLEGVHEITDGDWIITGIKGERYP